MRKSLIALVLFGTIFVLSIYFPREGGEVIQKAWDFPLQGSNVPSGRKFHIKSGDLECGGGYVYAIQSRIFTNSNDLEFWCRSGPIKLNFLPLGKPASRVYRTSIANIQGELYNFQTRSVFDFEEQEWVRKDFGTPAPFIIQPKSDANYIITHEGGECPGIALYRDDYYLGTVKTEEYSAVAVWDGQFYVNTGEQTFVADVPPDEAESCRMLHAKVFDKDKKYAYGIFREPGGEILIGGAQGGYGKSSEACSPSLGRFPSGKESRLTGCVNGMVKEYYSYAPYAGGIYIGNFPIGTLLRYSEGQLSLTDIAVPTDRDWRDPLGTYYRESQAVVNAYGATFVGMYPWGEVMVAENEGNRSTYRLFEKPERGTSPTPYFWSAHERSKALPGVSFDANAEIVYSLTRDGISLRDEGLEPTFWGQRIPSIVVLSGRLCASTGNLGGAPYNPKLHPDLSREEAQEYGRVFCADLLGHVMAPMPSGKVARFIITDKSLIIEIDGSIVAKAAHGLTLEQLVSLD